MAKKKQREQKSPVDVQVTAGGRRICPDCKLQFRHEELFNQHRSIGCKPEKTDGPTWSPVDPEAVESESSQSAE